MSLPVCAPALGCVAREGRVWPRSFGAGSPAPRRADGSAQRASRSFAHVAHVANARRPTAGTDSVSLARPSICRQRSGCVVRIRTAADRAAANAGGRRLSEIPSLILWDTYPKRDCRLTPQFRLAFLEAPPICLRGGCTIWHSRQRCARLPASPRPGQGQLCPYLFRD